jgi:hypothetical protein
MLIGFTGPMGAGKSEAGLYLRAHLGWGGYKMAGPLKDMMRALGLTDREIEGDLKEAPSPLLLGSTPRFGMQTLGTEWGREIMGQGFWTNIARHNLSQRLAYENIVVDDIRFENEANLIHELGGFIVCIDGRKSATADTGHKSEHGLSDLLVNHIVQNTGTKLDLHVELHLMLEALKLRAPLYGMRPLVQKTVHGVAHLTTTGAA